MSMMLYAMCVTERFLAALRRESVMNPCHFQEKPNEKVVLITGASGGLR